MSACSCPSGIVYFVLGVIATLTVVALAWAVASRAPMHDGDHERPPGSGGYQPRRIKGPVNPPPRKP